MVMKIGRKDEFLVYFFAEAYSGKLWSFITEIYIAHLQDYYSEALPTLTWLKRRVLRLE